MADAKVIKALVNGASRVSSFALFAASTKGAESCFAKQMPS
jgi:hypothetical protein